MTDPIADMLTRIRNAYRAHHDNVTLPHSNLKERLANILVKEGYLETMAVAGDGVAKVISINLKYIGKSPAISTLDRVSTPGRRVYSASKAIKPVLGGFGTKIISTNQGLLTDKEAHAKGVGGEIICKVY